jgi:hypothetical protein
MLFTIDKSYQSMLPPEVVSVLEEWVNYGTGITELWWLLLSGEHQLFCMFAPLQYREILYDLQKCLLTFPKSCYGNMENVDSWKGIQCENTSKAEFLVVKKVKISYVPFFEYGDG